jgi:hypothetical protein
MDTVLKTILACALGLGFMIMDAHSRPSLAFLGLSRDSDPMIREKLAGRIQFELSADTGLSVFSKDEVNTLFAKGLLNEPEAGPGDMARLAKGLGAQYYAFGRLQGLSNETSKKWWKPWDVKVKWNQAMRLRVLDGSTGATVFDGVASGTLDEKAFFVGPDAWEKMGPLERDGYLNRMMAVLSVESAKTIAKAVKAKANPAKADTAAASAAGAAATAPAK